MVAVLLFGFRFGVLTVIILLPYTVYYLIGDHEFFLQGPEVYTFTIVFLTEIVSIILGAFLRFYHQLLLGKIRDLRESVLKTRELLVFKSNEEAILRAINNASLTISSSKLPLEQSLRIIVSESRKLLKGKFAAIGLQENGTNKSPFLITSKTKTIQTKKHQLLLFSDLLTAMIQEQWKHPRVIAIHKQFQFHTPAFHGFDKVLAAPIWNENRIIGGLLVTNDNTKVSFKKTDIEKIRLFAAHAGIVIANASYNTELQNLIKMRDQFALVASHEFKTPLSTIKLYAELIQRRLEQTSVDSTIMKHVEIMNRQADKMVMLIEEFIDFSRLESGKLRLNKKTVDLQKVCEDLSSVMQQLYPSHKFIYTVKGAGPFIVFADSLRLEQVFTNICTNAVKYSSEGTTITCIVQKKGKYVDVAFTDQGKGISEKDQKHIFDPFYQVSRFSPSSQSVSLGLGLYIAKEIVQRHHGTLSVVSELGKGSTFFIRLPFYAVKEKIHEPQEKSSKFPLIKQQ